MFDTLLEEGILPKKEEVSDEKKEGEPSGEEAPKEEGSKAKKGCNTEEILAVLAHELGHWKLSHNLKNIVIAEVTGVQSHVQAHTHTHTHTHAHTHTHTHTGELLPDPVHVRFLHEAARPVH